MNWSNYFFDIFSFFYFNSIYFTSTIPNTSFIFFFFFNLSFTVSISDSRLSFTSVCNLSISFIFSVVILLNFISSLILFGLPKNLLFIVTKLISNSCNSSIFSVFSYFSILLIIIFFISNVFSNFWFFYSIILKLIKLSITFSISILILHGTDYFFYMCVRQKVGKSFMILKNDTKIFISVFIMH